MILDILLIVLVALFIFIGYKRGIMKSLYGFISLAVSGVGSYFIGRFLSNFVYTTFFAKGVNESISNSISTATESVNASSKEIFENLPQHIQSFLGFFGITEAGVFDTTESALTLETELQNAVMSAVVEVLGFIFIIVLFILLLLIMKMLSKYILFIFEVPVIKQINSIFGMVFGLAEGLIICYIAVLVCRLVLQTADQPFIDVEIINNSFIFSNIYYSDFIAFITGVFTNIK